MSTDLKFHLYPKGRSATEPDLMPSVLDSDGNSVRFTSEKRKTTEATVVDLGDSPNSNNGDPLRTAFAKINNFIEASYWTNEGVNQKFRDIDSELNEGIAIYTDSDEKIGLSFKENTKLKFSGTANQIETNVINVRSPSNTTGFDSEVIINFQLTETVNISTLKVLEHAQFDSDVGVSGNLTVASNLLVGGVSVIERLSNIDSDIVATGAGQTASTNVLQTQIVDNDSDILALQTLVDGGTF